MLLSPRNDIYKLLTNIKITLVILTGHLPMSQKVVQTQNHQFPRNLCQSTLPWSKLTTQNISGLRWPVWPWRPF